MKASSDSMKKSFQSISRVNKNEISTNLTFNNEICSVCAEMEPKFWSISSCGHKICWICSLRLRALYNSKSCPICKTQNDFIFICKIAEDGFEFEKKLKSFPQNTNLSIAYENEVVKSACENLLQLQCPFNQGMSTSSKHQQQQQQKSTANAACLKNFKSKSELRKHVQNSHELLMCEICLEHKKCFTVELALYNRTSLQKHQREANHPRCQVCDRIFYSEDELNEHCRDAHELCHICQRTGRPGRHFLNYSRLEEHFGKEHFLCPEPLCRELKFVVFENELEYKTHQAEVHLAHQKLQRSQQRQLQRLNISFGSDSVNNSTSASSTSTSQSGSNTISPSPLKLTSDQRNQIAANLIYGEVTDDLANRLQSLSLYQNRNDDFIELLRGSFHLNQSQINAISESARSYQRNDISATELILKVEKVLGNGSNNSDLIKIANGLSELQLNEIKRQRLDFAISQYQEKCTTFPELGRSGNKIGAASKPLTWAGKGKNIIKDDDDEKSVDPFGFARSQASQASSAKPPGFLSRNAPSTILSASDRSVKVLQILKPSNPAAPPPSRSADPSKNPAILLSQLAGGPAIKKKSSSSGTGTVKMTTFSSAALGSVSASKVPTSTAKTTKLNDQEFPSLSSKTTEPSIPIASTATATPASTGNAFFAPSDRDQLESFTIGNDGVEPKQEQPSATPSSGKKTKKLVFRYGQKWDV